MLLPGTEQQCAAVVDALVVHETRAQFLTGPENTMIFL